MLIDWFTVGAQTLNFLILVWLLKRFLYKPILDAVDAREKRIAAELADADVKKAEALKERNDFQQKNADFDQQHAARLSEMTAAVNVERQRLLDEARQAADVLTNQRMETLRNESNNLGEALRKRTQDEVFGIARKTLKDLATTSLEERLGEVFTRRLRELDDNAKVSLAAALKNSATSPALIRSAFELPQQQRAAIQNALNETFSAEIKTRFETAPDLIAGIELSTGGQKVAWSIAEYLASLEQGVTELLKSQVEPKAVSEPVAKSAAVIKPEAVVKSETSIKKAETATTPERAP